MAVTFVFFGCDFHFYINRARAIVPLCMYVCVLNRILPSFQPDTPNIISGYLLIYQLPGHLAMPTPSYARTAFLNNTPFLKFS